MEKVEVVTFDIADQSFDYYTMEQWKRQIEIWREELEELDMEDLTDDEVVEAMYGDELFYDIV
jgi:hypothetical protein